MWVIVKFGIQDVEDGGQVIGPFNSEADAVGHGRSRFRWRLPAGQVKPDPRAGGWFTNHDGVPVFRVVRVSAPLTITGPHVGVREPAFAI